MGCFVLIKSTVTFTFHITIWGTFGWDMLVLPRTDPTRLAHFSTWAVREVYAHDARYTVNVCSLWDTWSALNRGTCTLRTFGAFGHLSHLPVLGSMILINPSSLQSGHWPFIPLPALNVESVRNTWGIIKKNIEKVSEEQTSREKPLCFPFKKVIYLPQS